MTRAHFKPWWKTRKKLPGFSRLYLVFKLAANGKCPVGQKISATKQLTVFDETWIAERTVISFQQTVRMDDERLRVSNISGYVEERELKFDDQFIFLDPTDVEVEPHRVLITALQIQLTFRVQP